MNGDLSALQAHVETLAAEAPVGTLAPSFRGYAEVMRDLLDLARCGLGVHLIGRSVRGLPLFALSLGEEGRPTSAVMAGVHAMEWIGVEVAQAALERLAADPPEGQRVVAIPVVNPDGYRMVEDDLRAGRRRFRRANANGVDLNRNWPLHHRPGARLAQRLLPFLGHAGSRPMSEPEVAAVVAFLQGQPTRVARAISLHSIGEMVLYPFGGRWRPPQDVARSREAAEALAARLPGGYRVVQSARWVPGTFAHGMELDWLHAGLGAAAVLVECSLGSLSVRAPETWLAPMRWFNPPNPAQVADELAPAVEAFLRGQ